ncbi:PPK2 family polyphosphate kinase [Nocardioides jishulii]|uniref:Polyphosphate kinase 2 family protein n=1 Tax=Nocardioides jishulii TaxID=2575440 RepID=A0A4V5TK83_9ACTN|nr:PPK2 family polyphosphate kinase [Nocardioides jishulii]QCX27756.1 polyphosphate kinase 2 family protein [Nocardioides jishulii]TKI62563.1 polyphosphate kinase 2 family protein [Nocardioides jishulii]
MGDDLTFDTTALALPPGPVDLTALPTDGTPGFTGDKAAGEAALASIGQELADLQERLWAGREHDASRRVLLILQGMDTSGKGGVIRKSLGLVDPQGLKIKAFKAPTPEELEHDFLWRIRQALPDAGYIGVFDRSHYEDVLIHRVRGYSSPEEIERRYDQIVDFEQELVADGVTVVKCMLHVGADEQKKRLLKRLDNPEKHWKFNPGDVDERALWPQYQRAYEIALERTHHPDAGWFVIPADHKWYRNLAVAALLHDTLARMDLRWPVADFDVAAERARLEALVIE